MGDLSRRPFPMPWDSANARMIQFHGAERVRCLWCAERPGVCNCPKAVFFADEETPTPHPGNTGKAVAS